MTVGRLTQRRRIESECLKRQTVDLAAELEEQVKIVLQEEKVGEVLVNEMISVVVIFVINPDAKPGRVKLIYFVWWISIK